MLDKLKAIKEKYISIGEELIKPEVISDSKRYTKLVKEYNNIEPLCACYDKLKKINDDREEINAMLQTEQDNEI